MGVFYMEALRSSLLVLFLWLLTHTHLSADEALTSRSFDTKIIQSGHSLTDPIPKMLRELIATQGARGITIDRSTIPGSPMDWRWENGHKKKIDARRDIGNYDLLVLTERVPLDGTLKYHNSDELALRWFSHAWNYGRKRQGAETILFATWVELGTGPGHSDPSSKRNANVTWRDRLIQEMLLWEQIRTFVNKYRPSGTPQMQLIPGPLIMAAVYDGIEAGQAPSLNSITDLFKDDIHLNSWGNYLITLAHYSVIYGRDPRGLPHRVGQKRPVSRELAEWMQELVWQVVTDYTSNNG
ncbi:MAG: hypothetical protein ABJZ69_14875 [Hyphomicrobiales bacterium]